MKTIVLLLVSFIPIFLLAQSDTILKPRNKTADSSWSTHFQFTVVSQTHGSFQASYSGLNSLSNGVERGLLTITTTAFIGRKIFRYTNVYANPEISADGVLVIHGALLVSQTASRSEWAIHCQNYTWRDIIYSNTLPFQKAKWIRWKTTPTR